MKKVVGLISIATVLVCIFMAGNLNQQADESEKIQTYKGRDVPVQRIYMEPMEIKIPVTYLDFTDEEPMLITPQGK